MSNLFKNGVSVVPDVQEPDAAFVVMSQRLGLLPTVRGAIVEQLRPLVPNQRTDGLDGFDVPVLIGAQANGEKPDAAPLAVSA